jgi:hypothetical protein
VNPTNRVRFAWWGGEEFGLLGSEFYVSHLSSSELKDIELNLNFDMIASPNFVRFVYDGDGSGTGTSGPNGSANIEKVFTDYFASQGLATDPTAFDGRSDYGPFIDRGIPAGGLFTGAEGIKTAQQAAVYGGTAGVAYDSCYHQLCDDITNVNRTALDQMSDATADATLQFAMTTSSVNGTSKSSDQATASTDYFGSWLRKYTHPSKVRAGRQERRPSPPVWASRSLPAHQSPDNPRMHVRPRRLTSRDRCPLARAGRRAAPRRRPAGHPRPSRER